MDRSHHPAREQVKKIKKLCAHPIYSFISCKFEFSTLEPWNPTLLKQDIGALRVSFKQCHSAQGPVMEKSIDQRLSARVPIGYRVKIMADEKDILCPSAINISMSGILVRASERLPVGTGCYVIIFLLEGGAETKILAWGIVVREAPEGMAIRFSRILGDQGTQHLRNLVSLKSSDPAQAKREFEAFARPKAAEKHKKT